MLNLMLDVKIYDAKSDAISDIPPCVRIKIIYKKELYILTPFMMLNGLFFSSARRIRKPSHECNREYIIYEKIKVQPRVQAINNPFLLDYFIPKKVFFYEF